ncbi:hypothetical protein DITRI_Ditri12bG0085200 [Diplodiscus trichospermus]
MSSKRNVLQEFQFPEASRNRNKVDIDGFRLTEAAKDTPWQREQEKNPEPFESKYDLRKSLAWDSAFFTSPGVLDPEELFETLNIHVGDNGLKEAIALPSESMAAASRIGECIARRSLAWDAAFFTSAGVLNPEELCMVNNGYKKSETQTFLLPGIEEEFRKSAESNFTKDSDYSLSSLENDLFDDMRATIQKSSKPSHLVSSSCKLQSQTGISNCNYSKRLDASSMKTKPLPASRRPKSTSHGIAKAAKEAINPPQAQQAARIGEPHSSSSLKQSKAFSQDNPLLSAATKRSSLGANHIKVKNKIRKAVSGENMPKKPCITNSATSSPEPTASRFHIASRDLSGSFCGHMTSIDKSPNTLRRKNDLAASGSNAGTPSRSFPRHKSKQLDLSRPTDLQSTPKSPISSLFISIDRWSSGSLASVNHASNNFTKSLDTASHRELPVNNDASQGSNTNNCSSDQPFVQSGSKETRLPCKNADRFSKESVPPPANVSRETKPSGLRLPSPKIGFFDAEKSRELTPNGGLKFHSGMQNASKTRSGANHLNGTPNRARHGKLQPPRTSRTASIKEKKLAYPQSVTQSSRSMKPICAAQLEGEKVCQEFTSYATIGGSPATSFKAETDLSCESSDGSKAQSFGSYLKGQFKGKIQSESKEHVTQMVKQSWLDQNEDTNALNRNDKENLYSFKNQVDVLSKQMEAIDVNEIC